MFSFGVHHAPSLPEHKMVFAGIGWRLVETATRNRDISIDTSEAGT
jgi:hypothetical protein